MTVAGIGSLFGENSAASQFLIWGVGFAIAEKLLAPVLADIEQGVNEADPVLVLSPQDLADMVVRGIVDASYAADEATKSGIDGTRFQYMVESSGEPPGLETVLEMWRRGYIPWADGGPEVASVERAIKTSRIYNYWSDAIQKVGQIPLAPGEAVNAALRGQAPFDQMATEAEASGIDAARFQILVDSAGRPPSPGELVELLRRKLIPETGVGPGVVSFQQGIYEGDAKDKWWTLYAALTEYLPPPRTITALERSGAMDAATAQKYYQDAGMTPELAAVYSKNASGDKLAGTKQLAEGLVLTLYEGQAITAADATARLGALGYGATEAGFLLEYSDLSREVKALNSAVTRIGTLYVGHKITRQAAANALDTLEAPSAHRDHLLTTWDLEAAANVRPLTEAQIADAWEYQSITEGEALAELQAIGLTPFDAWVVLSNKNKAPLPGKPPRGPGGPGTT